MGAATEVHYPAVGFFHDKHNVCMRRRKADSHFGQMRLALGTGSGDDQGHGTDGFSGVKAQLPPLGRRVWYHDVYAQQWFLTFEELARVGERLSCASILDQHVCEDTPKPQNYRESRYCYFRGQAPLGGQVKVSEAQENAAAANAAEAKKVARRMGAAALRKKVIKKKKKNTAKETPPGRP